MAEVELCVYVSGIEKRKGQDTPTKQDEQLGRHYRKEATNEGQQAENHKATWGKNHSGCFRRIAQQALGKLREHDDAAKQNQPEHEHHQVRTGVVEIFEEPDVEDRLVLLPFPNDQCNEGND